MMEVELVGPPGFDYETVGPWFVCHNAGDRAQAWVMHTLQSAVLRFWSSDRVPQRRVIVDARGVTILGIANLSEDRLMACGTRVALDATLACATLLGSTAEQQMQVVEMIETIRAVDGQPI